MNPQTYANNPPLHVPLVPAAAFPSLVYTPLLNGVQAGFPSPAGDYMEKGIDLNEYLIEHKSATFFMRVNGDSMTDAYIAPGSLVVVDRSLKPQHGSIVIAVVDGEFTCKRLEKRGTEMRLVPESPNPKFKPLILSEGMEVNIWGVVTSIVIDAKTV
jgi:DNA polymerase V